MATASGVPLRDAVPGHRGSAQELFSGLPADRKDHFKRKTGRWKVKAFPTKFEIYDDIKEAMASVEAQDECCAKVKIDALVSAKDWPDLSARIQECLVAMELE
jgi:hypothetical protein